MADEHSAACRIAVSVLARALRATFTARQAELNYERAAGKLVRVDDFERAYADTLSAARDALLTVPDRIAAKVAARSDRAECWRMIDSEIRTAMRGLGNANA